ncbi:DoxX family protein [Kribbella sp. CA-245084]|uniref:DoxX family protein n=1 Tax=Kribbella sp. CA-245084 TaxID=3239940 RepID=UPI003D93D6ED
MLAGYIAVTVVAAIAYASAAIMNFTHNSSVTATAERLHVPVTWQVPLGVLLAAGSVGLVAGFAVPALGTAAACGLVLYFTAAAAAHLRAHDTRVSAWLNWAAFFTLSVAALAAALADHGPL